MTQGHGSRKELRKCLCVWVCVCMCVYVCVLKTEASGEKKREGAEGVTRQLGLDCPWRSSVSC